MRTLFARHGQRSVGLALALTASLIELGPVVQLLRDGRGLTAVLAAGFAYQVGGVVARSARGYGWHCLAGATAGSLLITLTESGRLFWLLGLALLAWALQAVRRTHAEAFPNDSPPNHLKRGARVLGFVVATFAPTALGAIATTLATALAESVSRGSHINVALKFSRPSVTELAMVSHQIHYFVYCYGVLAILSQVSGGPEIAGILFAAGWITYLSAERLWAPLDFKAALVSGHILVALTLVGLSVYGHQILPAVGLWLLTGLGGGTVYCLTQLHHSEGRPHGSMDRAEDIGHVGGTAIAFALNSLFGVDAFRLALVGAIFALVTPAIIIFLSNSSFSAPQQRRIKP